MAHSTSVTRTHVYYRGYVQGVGFRFTTARVAEDYDVTGYVRNMPDGRVEVVAEGETPTVRSFLRAVGQAMKGNILSSDQQEEPPTGEFRSFGIRY